MVGAGGFGQRGTQRQAQTQVQALSQGQRQSLALLAMSLPELRAELFRQMEQNVVIDEIEPTLERETISQKEDESDAEEREFASDYTEDDDRPETAYTADEDALERRQRFFDSQTREETLEEHLLNQLAMSDLDEKDIPLAEILIGELDDNGFFAGSVPDIVMVSGESERKIRAVLGEIRKLDPLGCGATTVEECLLAQLDKLDGSPYREEVREILTRGHLKDIAAGRREAVEADLGMSDERYDDVLAALRTLEPRPGRAYVRAGKSVTYVNPEVHARLVDGRWVARVDDRSLPDIRISARYLKMLEDPKLPPETKAYIRERIQAAHAIAEAVARRQETITNIAQAIFDAQPGFFEKGLKGLKPLTMHEVAAQVGVHPATVSRTVNDKYVSTPKGTVELRKFFSQGFATADGGEVSKDEVAEKIRALIDGEDKAAPLSDEKIARALAAAGLKVARRTVAKYRLKLGLPGTAERAAGAGAGK